MEQQATDVHHRDAHGAEPGKRARGSIFLLDVRGGYPAVPRLGHIARFAQLGLFRAFQGAWHRRDAGTVLFQHRAVRNPPPRLHHRSWPVRGPDGLDHRGTGRCRPCRRTGVAGNAAKYRCGHHASGAAAVSGRRIDRDPGGDRHRHRNRACLPRNCVQPTVSTGWRRIRTLWNVPVTNYSRERLRRHDLTVVIGNDEDLDAAQATLLELAKDHPAIEHAPAPSTFIADLSKDGTSLTLRYWVATGRWWATTREMLRGGKTRLLFAGATRRGGNRAAL